MERQEKCERQMGLSNSLWVIPNLHVYSFDFSKSLRIDSFGRTYIPGGESAMALALVSYGAVIVVIHCAYQHISM